MFVCASDEFSKFGETKPTIAVLGPLKHPGSEYRSGTALDGEDGISGWG